MIWNELKKVIRRPIVWGIFGLTFFMNMVLLGTISGESFSPQSYRNLWETFNQKEVSLYDELKQEKKQDVGMEKSEQELHKRYQKELEHLLSYSEYQQGILQDAKRMQKFSAFARNQFASENVRKTAEHFRKMPPIEVELGPSMGIEKFFSRITVVFSLLFMFLIGYLLFVWEKENKLSVLLSITKRGKKTLCLCKLLAHIMLVAFHAIFLYAGNFIVLGYQYGFGNLGRSIQSVLAYRSCGYTLSVGEFLLAGVIVAVLILVALVFVLDLICICCGSLIHSVIGLCLTFGLSLVAYVSLALNSSVGWLKYISPVFCLDTGEIFGKYVNIDFFGNAVYYPYAIAVVYGILALICLCLSCFLFGRTTVSGKIKVKFVKEKRLRKIRMSVFLFEWKKISKNSHAGFLLLLFLILAISVSYKERLIFEDEDEYYYYSYMEQVAGERTKETEQFIEKTKQEFSSLQKRQRELFQIKENDESNAEILDELSQKMRPWNGFRKFLNRDQYLKRNQLDTYVYDTGFKKLVSFRDNEENRLLFLLSMLLLILLLSSVFAADREHGFETLLNLTARKRKMNRSKIMISIWLVFAAFLVLYGPQFLVFLRLYGISGFMEPLACIKMSTVLGTSIPIWAWLLWHYFKVLVGMLLVGGGILIVSERMKRTISVMVVSLLVLAGVSLVIFSG